MKIYPNSIKRTFFIIFFLSVLLHQGCDKLKYTPTGISEKENIDPPDPSTVWIKDYSFGTETLKIWGNKKIHFHFESNRPIVAVRVLFINIVLYQCQGTNQGSFIFESTNYDNGSYFLTFEILLKTESGSLASVLNSEFFVAIRRVPILIINHKTLPSKITSVPPE